jgi:hypothetical protein
VLRLSCGQFTVYRGFGSAAAWTETITFFAKFQLCAHVMVSCFVHFGSFLDKQRMDFETYRLHVKFFLLILVSHEVSGLVEG